MTKQTPKKRFKKVVKYHWLLNEEKYLFLSGLILLASVLTHLISIFYRDGNIIFAFILTIAGLILTFTSIPSREVYWEET